MRRFNRIGVTRYLFAPTLTDPCNPTLAELAAAIDITCEAQGVAGFTPNYRMKELESDTTPDNIGIVGTRAALNPTFAMHDLEFDGSVLRPMFEVGTTGYLIVAPYGVDHLATDGGRVEVFPVMSAGNDEEFTGARNDPALWILSLVVTGPRCDAIIDTDGQFALLHENGDNILTENGLDTLRVE